MTPPRTKRALFAALCAAAVACGRSKTAEETVGEAAARPAASSSATAAIPSAVGASRSVGAWQGSYKSAPATIYIPAEWKDVHWKVKESGSGLGDGAMSIQVDAVTHRVNGTLDGPLGPATIEGGVWDGKLSGSILRKDPSDQGFIGTLVGTLAGDRAEGTLAMSLGEASAVRSATFTLAPEGTSPASH